MRVWGSVVVLVIALGSAGCGSSSNAPSPAPSPSASGSLPTGPPVVDQVPLGYVMDTAFRALAGVRVEIVDGPQAGRSMTSDATGQFTLTGPFVSTNTFRAVKDGYVTATQGFSTSTPGGRPWLYFYLSPLAAPLNIAGDYFLSFVADSACADLPSQVRMRTYAATITGSNSGSPANTSFALTVSGASFFDTFRSFTIGVAGDTLGFWLDGGHDAPIVEQLGANTYLAYSGAATATLGTSPASTVSTPFDGWIEYCVLKSPMGAFYNCGTSTVTGQPMPGLAIEYARCESTSHRLVLNRR